MKLLLFLPEELSHLFAVCAVSLTAVPPPRRRSRHTVCVDVLLRSVTDDDKDEARVSLRFNSLFKHFHVFSSSEQLLHFLCAVHCGKCVRQQHIEKSKTFTLTPG